MKQKQTFALIVGGGPVGLTAAIELGRRNVPAIVVTQNTETAAHPKCNYVNARTMEHYRRLGFADEVRQQGIPADFPREVAFVSRFCGYEYSRLTMPLPQLSRTAAPFAEPPHHGSQLLLEPVLRRQAELQASVDVRFGWRVLDLSRQVDDVLARVQNVASGEVQEISARYLIGADGSRSLTRGLVGAEMNGEDGSEARDFMSGTLLAFFFRAPSLQQASGRRPAVLTQIINPDLRAFMFPLDNTGRWVTHYQVPRGVQWQEVDQAATLRAILGADVEFELLSVGPWTGGLALIADRYRRDGAFLAGDAAHQFTPLGGFGLNTGVGDAVNLCWKLAAVHDGWAGPQLLASYEVERRPIGWRNSRIGLHCGARKARWRIPADIEATTPQGQLARDTFGAFCAPDDADEYATLGLQLGERYDDSPIVASDPEPPPPDSWADYLPTDRPGGRLPHFLMDDGRPVFDACGPGFTLIDFGADDGSEHGIVDAAAKRRLPLTVLRCAGPATSALRSRFLLVRPDQHIAWRGNSPPEDPLAAIDLIRGAASLAA